MGMAQAANTGNLFFQYQGGGLLSPSNLLNPVAMNGRMVGGGPGPQGLFSP